MAEKNTIRNFMWGYQRHFRLMMSFSAEKLFSLIDPEFTPRLFLVGSRIPGATGVPVAVEPEENFWLTAEMLKARWPADIPGPEAPLSEDSADGMAVRRWRRQMRQGVLSVLRNAENRLSDRRYFAALPVQVGAFWVTAVLELDAEALATYGYDEAEEAKAEEHEGRLEFLLQAVIEIFLSRVTSELGQTDPFGNILLGGELLRTAASQLVDALVFETTSQYESSGFYEKCVRISSAFYERTPAIGTMIIADQDDKGVNFEVKFAEPPPVADTRKARKLLQTANDFDLHSDGAYLYGLVRPSRSKSRLKVNFLGHHQWQITRGGKTLVEVRYDEPGLPRPPFDPGRLAEGLHKIFPKLRSGQSGNLVKLIDHLSRSRHGALLVITEVAAREAKRLKMQAMPIVRKKLTPALLDNLSSIDGAVLMNPRGIAFAMGAILDGPATSAGNPARGARYNSAIRYQEYLKNAYGAASFIVVVSDDGDMNFLPELSPRAVAKGYTERLYEEIAELSRYGKSLFARHDSDAIKVLFEPLEPEKSGGEELLSTFSAEDAEKK